MIGLVERERTTQSVIKQPQSLTSKSLPFMSLLTYPERQLLERELRMGGGYVLDFTNPQFEDFFRSSVGIDITAAEFNFRSGSKANRLRAFWDSATPENLTAFFDGLLDCWALHDNSAPPESIRNLIKDIKSRLEDLPRSLRFEDIHFEVALSFPGTSRGCVAEIATEIRKELGQDSVFYDKFYQAHLARPNLDVLLQRIYHRKSSLVVVFLGSGYANSEWCGLEWRAIRDIIKKREGDQLMLIRLDDHPIDGIFGTDGYIDAKEFSPKELAQFILDRTKDIKKRPSEEPQQKNQATPLPQIFGDVRKVTSTFPQDKDSLTRDHAEALLALSRAYHATNRYYLNEEKNCRLEELKWEIAEKWHEVGIRLRKFDHKLADRLHQKSQYWRDGASWSDSAIQEAEIDLEGIWHEVNKRLAT